MKTITTHVNGKAITLEVVEMPERCPKQHERCGKSPYECYWGHVHNGQITSRVCWNCPAWHTRETN